ncbi:MAG: M56 family metallopeptidase [Verrucomicrobiae bacterium]|nr:M56 family metallopeptidase [Verrucomicrobiae bacterium]
MNSPLPLVVVTVLIKWTLLLALGWTAHWRLREKHSRWRLILWRSLLCFGLILPLTAFVPLPVFHIPVRYAPAPVPELPDLVLSATVAGTPMSAGNPATGPAVKPAGLNAVQKIPAATPAPQIAKKIPWANLLLLLWGLGAAFAGARLVRLQWRLARIRQASRAVDFLLQNQMQNIQARLGMKRKITVRVSDAVMSPFACGLRQPVILLPEKLVQELPPDEISALLAHELAHFQQHDLFWCVGWRWVQTLCWFHPLVWKIPAAHNLACEQEADRIASSQLGNDAAYPQLLARLALRVLALPAVETQLVVNGSSQIAQRLMHLKNDAPDAWKRRHSVAGFALAGLLFVLATGCELSKNNPATANFPSTMEYKQVLVVVQDKDGRPLAGATIKPFGYRVQGVRQVDGHGWDTNRFGPVVKATTDDEGRAWIKYPVVAIPEEKLLTGQLTFTVSHPEYCSEVNQGYPVDGSGKPIHLVKGIVLEVTGYYGKDRQPVTEFVPTLGQDGAGKDDWQTNENGVYNFRQLAAGGHLVQLMGRLPAGEIVYSDSIVFTAEPGKTNHFDLEMSPGIRIEGRLDDNVPRPVKNGRVLIAVRPRQIPAYLVPEDWSEMWTRFGYFRFWHTYRPVAEDGTFVFESVPPGEVDVIVHGDGFASKSIGQVRNRINGQLSGNGPKIGIPQPFPLTAPVTKVEIITEPTATLELTAKTKSGQPIEGATVYLNPNVLRIGGIFGWMRDSSEKPFRTLEPLPDVPYSGKTDSAGKVVIKNIPAEDRGLEIDHPAYVIPLQQPHGLPNRRVRTDFAPGITNVMTVTMQLKGRDFIGMAK